jgi:hypothetical protein
VFVDGGVKIYGPEYASTVLGIDPNALLTDLRASIPEAPHQGIEMFKDQWIMGDNPCLTPPRVEVADDRGQSLPLASIGRNDSISPSVL